MYLITIIIKLILVILEEYCKIIKNTKNILLLLKNILILKILFKNKIIYFVIAPILESNISSTFY